jgi:hypothetical protein
MGRQKLSGPALAAKRGNCQNYLAKRLRDGAVLLSVNDIENIPTALQIPLLDLIREATAIEAKIRHEGRLPE